MNAVRRRSLLPALLVFVWLMLCLLMPHAFAEDNQKLVFISDGQRIYQVMNGNLCLLNDQFQTDDIVYVGIENVNAATYYDDAFYFACRVDAGVRFVRLMDDQLITLFEVATDKEVLDMAISDDKLAVIWRYAQGEKRKDIVYDCGNLVVYSMDGTLMYDTGLTSNAISAADDGIIVVEDMGNVFNRIHKMDIAEGAFSDYMQESSVLAICEIAEKCIFVNPNGVHIVDRESGENRVIESKNFYDDMETGICLLPLEDSVAVVRKINNEISRISLSNDSTQVLTLVNCEWLQDSRMRTAVETFETKHPDIKVEFLDIQGKNLQTSLMAQEPGMDILAVTNTNGVIYADAGVLLDLSQYPGITEKLDSWIDIFDAVTWNGILYGIPESVMIDVFSVNEALREYVPQELDLNTASWIELMENGVNFDGDVTGDGESDIYLWRDDIRFPAWKDQYIASFASPEEINFDTDEFRKLMSLYKQNILSGAVGDAVDCDVNLAVVSVEGLVLPCTDKFYPMPTLENGRTVTSDTTISLAINQASHMKEYAIEFLEIYASEQIQSTLFYGEPGDRSSFCLLENSALNNELYQLLNDEEKALVEKSKAYMSEVTMSWQSGQFNAEFGDKVEMYVAGLIDLDTLIDDLQEKLQMILHG